MNIPRDNSATWVWHTRHVVNHECYADMHIDRAEIDEDGDRDTSELRNAPERLADVLVSRYARGDTLDELRERYARWVLPRFQRARELHQEVRHRPLTLKFDQPSSWMMLMAMICFDQDGAMITHPDDWFSPNYQPPLLAMVLKGFVPGYRYGDACNPRHKAGPHEQAVVEILLQPRASWAGALEAYLREWPQMMKPEGYRDVPDDNRDPFHQFPLHVAAAVCAYDIDDAAFAELPWYPRDLVAYYRTHVRQQRDAWRPADLAPSEGPQDSARLQGKKYALSKSQAYARWVELVAGTPERLTAARKALGRRKTMPELFDVMEALAGQGLAIQADIKDDETVEAQLLDLCRARGLPAPELPAEPPQGPARISALFDSLLAHAAAHGLAMAALDDGSDNWNAVLVATPSLGEFEQLCEQLGVNCLPDGGWA